jgi:hypothetical protein
MAFLRDTYSRFKDTVSETEKDIIALMRVHMKMCIRQYQTLIPQLDLIATQWGISIEAVLSQNDFGLPKLERKGQRRQGNQEDTEHSDQARTQQQPSAGSSQRGETLAADDRGCTVSHPPVTRCADFSESSQQKGMTSPTNFVRTLGVWRLSRGREMTKTRGLLPKVKGDVRMQKGQRKAQSAIQTRTRTE